MSLLNVVNRPVAVFDVNNREHRNLFAQYLKTRSWAASPVRFIASEVTDIDVGTISRQMLEFYTDREFNKTSKSAKTTV